ncbi:MarR family winged helix-turn-helix transcriptional regulator [Streptomyces reniochalinae]|uniref:MarR family winged helix-turn-helix transcriptional regulator n=1 Tax=Streptomyces reniochalinae TaxID=2250578 RepID=UPI0015F04BDE|nr:hypothetical protein [Streptomyces reniochalinae]
MCGPGSAGDGEAAGRSSPGGDAAEPARSVALGPKDVVGILDDLEGDGYVRREPHPADRRKNAVRLTEDGERLLARCAVAAERANDLLLEGFSARERAVFLSMLKRAPGCECRHAAWAPSVPAYRRTDAGYRTGVRPAAS